MKAVLRYCIHLYQKTLSLYIGQECRFYPSCSNYALECLDVFILPKAIFLIVYRLLRCNPLCKGGHDPVRKK